MTLDDDFISGYLALVARIWHDQRYRERLRADPRTELVASGWPIPAGAAVTVVTTDSLDIVAQVADWRAAATTGRYVIHLPLGAVQELTDEQLESIVGGALAVLARVGCPIPQPELTDNHELPPARP